MESRAQVCMPISTGQKALTHVTSVFKSLLLVCLSKSIGHNVIVH
jgi:hypothetical protein